MQLNETGMENSTQGVTDIPEPPQWVPLDTVIGLILAFSSCLFIGVSVIFKKLALRDIETQGGTRAVDGGYGYLRLPKWWLGISLMALGELTNFVAYIFAPAILVTPLGVFSIVCTAALSPYFLKERLGKLGKLGCVLVLVGCVVVTLCGPKDREIASMEELQSQLLHPGFLVYAGLVVLVSAFFMALVPRYGHRYVLLYITICSSFGSLSVMFCKGVGLALKQTVGGINEFTNWATWVCLVALIACLLIETIYMQRALDIFNSSVFMSINYVLFTSLVIVASSILYTELAVIGVKNIILTLLGFIVNIAALYLMHLDREDNTPPQADEESSDNTVQSQKAKIQLARPEQVTPLLGRAPASPLAGLNLPHTMFPTKTNSCMSLISQTSLPHHTSGDNHNASKMADDDDGTYTRHRSNSDDDRSNTEGTAPNNNNNNNNNKNNKNMKSNSGDRTPGHCRVFVCSPCVRMSSSGSSLLTQAQQVRYRTMNHVD
ncbi:Magnesium transporter NIPA2 [Portunus trituberculatus]|uniref:Magnesium transporter NIPA2 n=1 Tax=Portunus trituberculatus TaxID=210409 RepID=A0A5B7E8M7_PORTR|nr:Magnesium transporter NIPA2 [Portunus trituberculatus]